MDAESGDDDKDGLNRIIKLHIVQISFELCYDCARPDWQTEV